MALGQDATKYMLFDKDSRYIINFRADVGTDNLGDYIIMEAIDYHLQQLFSKEYVFIFNIAYHQPLHGYHCKRFIKILERRNIPHVKILSGANPFSLMYYPFRSKNRWAVGFQDMRYLKDLILFGVGSVRYIEKINSFKNRVKGIYGTFFWKHILNKNFTHAVRDSYTQYQLSTLIGINHVINLGCPTLWNLTKAHCENIPKEKSDEVIATFTDYHRDRFDRKILGILCKHYKSIYIWPQGIFDMPYIKYLVNKMEKCNKKIKILPPNIKELDYILRNFKVDYVGTRLHAGIRALQYKRRTLILSNDYRAETMRRDFGLPVISKRDTRTIEERIESKIEIKIRLNEKAIEDYLRSFREYVLNL